MFSGTRKKFFEVLPKERGRGQCGQRPEIQIILTEIQQKNTLSKKKLVATEKELHKRKPR